MTIWQIRHHLTKNHGHHPCKYGHFGKLSDRATLPSDTPRRHFRPFPLPKGATRHSPVTLPPLSAAQGCRAMRQENYSNYYCPLKLFDSTKN